MRNGNRFQVSAGKFRHLLRLPWMRSLAVLLQDKLQGWPHVGPLQSGVAWTIARLCWPISRFFLARLTTAWVTSSPACLHVYRAPALNCLWYHRAPSINGRTVWEDLRDAMERTIQDSDTGTLPLFFFLCVFLGIFPSVQLFPGSCRTGAHRGSYESTPRWCQVRKEETMRQFSLRKHLMI